MTPSAPPKAVAPGIRSAPDTEFWIKRSTCFPGMPLLVLVVVLPVFQLVAKSLQDAQGDFVGFANCLHHFKTPTLSNSLGNSLWVSLATTLIAVVLGFIFADALSGTCIPGKAVFKSIAMMPLFAPTLLNGIALIYLFGRRVSSPSAFSKHCRESTSTSTAR